MRDVEEVDAILTASVINLELNVDIHTLRSAHFSSSVTNFVSPGESSIRYSSGSSIVGCKTIWASFGLAIAATSVEAYRDKSMEDFIVDMEICGTAVWVLMQRCLQVAQLTR
jgi:hypothetical protein